MNDLTHLSLFSGIGDSGHRKDDERMELKCTLIHRNCGSTRCKGCGWEENEIWRRMQIRREIGLTKCEDGLWRLIVGRKEEDANEK